MSEPPASEGERLKQKQKKNKIVQQVSEDLDEPADIGAPASGSQATAARDSGEPSAFDQAGGTPAASSSLGQVQAPPGDRQPSTANKASGAYAATGSQQEEVDGIVASTTYAPGTWHQEAQAEAQSSQQPTQQPQLQDEAEAWDQGWSAEEWQSWRSTWYSSDWHRTDWQSQRSESSRAWPRRPSEGQQTQTSHINWHRLVQVNESGLLNIWASRCGLNAQLARKFRHWFSAELRRLKDSSGKKIYVTDQGCALAHDLDLSRNNLDDEALQVFLGTLKEARVAIGVAKLYRNNITCKSARYIAQWIRSAPWPIFELHLSHNAIGTAGALEIIKAVAETSKYPSVRPGSQNKALPLWLRLEFNEIGEEAAFVEKAEQLMREARPQATGKLICWFMPSKSELGCKSDYCGLATCSHCPVVHISKFHLNKADAHRVRGSSTTQAASGEALCPLEEELASPGDSPQKCLMDYSDPESEQVVLTSNLAAVPSEQPGSPTSVWENLPIMDVSGMVLQ